jgi:hypothetical protein
MGVAVAVRRNSCIVDGCESCIHAKGYCRRHYGQIWRKGEISPSLREKEISNRSSRADTERLRALERELKKAEHMYRVVIGYEGRVKWRREVDAVKAEIMKLEDIQSVHG